MMLAVNFIILPINPHTIVQKHSSASLGKMQGLWNPLDKTDFFYCVIYVERKI